MSKNKINIPRDCNLTNALCFATYKMLLQVFLMAFCILPTQVILAYLLPPDFCRKISENQKIRKYFVD